MGIQAKKKRINFFRKLLFSFSLVILLLIVIIVIGYNILHSTSNLVKSNLDNQVALLTNVVNLQSDLKKIRLLESELSRFHDYFAVLGTVDELRKLIKEFDADIQQFITSFFSEEDESARNVIVNWDTYHATLKKEMEMALEMELEEVEKISMYSTHPRFQIISERLREFSLLTEKKAQNSYQRFMNMVDTMKITFLVVIIIGIILVFGIAYFLSRSISGRLLQLQKGVQSFSKGEMDTPISIGSNDEISDLADSFNTMRVNIIEREQALKTSQEMYQRKSKELEKANNTLHDMNSNLEKMVDERTRVLKIAQDELIENAHRAGMTEISTNILHNIGNVLNSVMVSFTVVDDTIKKSSVCHLSKACGVLRDHLDTIESFIVHNPKGKKTLKFIIKTEEVLVDEKAKLIENLQRMSIHINLIRETLLYQQEYIAKGSMNERINLSEFAIKFFKLQDESNLKNHIELEESYEDVPEIYASKSKLMHIFINLYKNAKDAMAETNIREKSIRIEVYRNGKNVFFKMTDSGPGIEEENVNKIFQFGFTGKKNGHGFGLHSCANYMNEMGGKIWAESNKAGATFILMFPINTSEKEMAS